MNAPLLIDHPRSAIAEEAREPIDLPDCLRDTFAVARERTVRLGDLAEIRQGLLPRRDAFRRYGRPGQGWVPVLTGTGLDRFRLGAPDLYLRLDRAALMRFPTEEEVAAREKIVVSRVGPPLVAAVDTLRRLLHGDLYGIHPVQGIACGYLACILNSRVMDFYLNRVRPLDGAPSGSYLRAVDLCALPVPVPPPAKQRRLVAIASELEALAGATPLGGVRFQRALLLKEMNAEIFRLFEFGELAVRRMAELHF